MSLMPMVALMAVSVWGSELSNTTTNNSSRINTTTTITSLGTSATTPTATTSQSLDVCGAAAELSPDWPRACQIKPQMLKGPVFVESTDYDAVVVIPGRIAKCQKAAAALNELGLVDVGCEELRYFKAQSFGSPYDDSCTGGMSIRRPFKCYEDAEGYVTWEAYIFEKSRFTRFWNSIFRPTKFESALGFVDAPSVPTTVKALRSCTTPGKRSERIIFTMSGLKNPTWFYLKTELDEVFTLLTESAAFGRGNSGKYTIAHRSTYLNEARPPPAPHMHPPTSQRTPFCFILPFIITMCIPMTIAFSSSLNRALLRLTLKGRTGPLMDSFMQSKQQTASEVMWQVLTSK